jgi:hypothetical protein
MSIASLSRRLDKLEACAQAALQPLLFTRWGDEETYRSMTNNEPMVSATAVLTAAELDALSAAGHSVVVLHVEYGDWRQKVAGGND